MLLKIALLRLDLQGDLLGLGPPDMIRLKEFWLELPISKHLALELAKNFVSAYCVPTTKGFRRRRPNEAMAH